MEEIKQMMDKLAQKEEIANQKKTRQVETTHPSNQMQ